MLIGVSIALVVESIAVHALIGQRWPVANGVLIVLNIATLWYLGRHYRAVGATPVTVSDDELWIRHGASISARIPWPQVVDISPPDWKAQPPDTTQQYLKLSGGDDPNVLVKVEPPVDTTLVMGVRRRIALFGLRLDDAAAFAEVTTDRVAGRLRP